MVAFDAALFLVVGILLSCRRVDRSLMDRRMPKTGYTDSDHWRAESASVMREARENSAIQGKRSGR